MLVALLERSVKVCLLLYYHANKLFIVVAFNRLISFHKV